MRDALDAAWGDFPVGVLDWLRYTGSARPDAGWVNACLAAGLNVTFIQESYSTRSSEGYDVGVADCRYAEARAREVHPGVRSIAVVFSDGNYADAWDASEYGRGWSDTATLPFFGYGAHGVLDSGLTGAQRGRGAALLVLGNDGQPGRWVPETWGPTNLIGQVVAPSPVANTDLNHVHADYTGGSSTTIDNSEEADMLGKTDDGRYWDKASGLWVPLTATEAAAVYAAATGGAKITTLDLGSVANVTAANTATVTALKAAGLGGGGTGGAPDPAKEQALDAADAALDQAKAALAAARG